MTRTIEDRIKFDSGLTVGVHLVEFKGCTSYRKVLIEITSRGVVNGLAEPREDDMYAAWDRIKGDKWCSRPGTVAVWPARNPEFMARFSGEPSATIEI